MEWDGDVPAGGTAEIILTLRAKPGVSGGDSIAFEQPEISYEGGDDGSGYLAASSAAFTEISVAGCLPGDADADGDIGLDDVIALLRLLSGEDAEICPEADTDGDGAVGVTEAVSVLRMLAE